MVYQFYTLLNFDFIMIYIINEILVLLKITGIMLKLIFSNAFLRSLIDFYFLKKLIFFRTYNDEKFKVWKKKTKAKNRRPHY